MAHGKTIREWEQAVEQRSDIEFIQMNLRNGRVDSVIGIVKQPCKRKYRGVTHFRSRRVRWNAFGECLSMYGTNSADLSGFNIFS